MPAVGLRGGFTPLPPSHTFSPKATSCEFCARIQLRRVRVDCICQNVTQFELRFRHLPGVAVQLLFQSPYLLVHAQGELPPPVRSTKAPLHPLLSSLHISPLALVILDAVSFRNGV